MTKDLTQGSTGKILLSFSAPMFVSAIFQQLYSMADSIIAGRFAGKNALAAVGASYPVTMIFIAVALGSSVGVSVVISQLFGKGDYRSMKTAISTSLISISVLSVLLTVLGSLFSSDIISALHVKEDIFADSDLYLKIYIWGLFFLFLYNACTGILNAMGDSKTPLILLICSSVGNILLDMFFVIALHMGVSGVAWATFIAQGISGIAAFVIVLRRFFSFKVQGSGLFSFKMLGKISYLAIPSILQQSFVSIGNLLIQSLVNGYSTDVIAGYSAAVKLNTFTITAINTLGTALSNFTAQNYGASKFDRIRSSLKISYKMTAAFALPFTFIYFVFAKQCIGLFLDPAETEAINIGVSYMKIVSPFYIFISLKIMCDGILRGMSKVFFFMITTFSDLLLRVGLSFVLSIPFGYTGIWLSWPIGWVTSMIIAVVLYARVAKTDLSSPPPVQKSA